MRTLLLHPDREFAMEAAPDPHWDAVERDLDLATLLGAMAGEDAFLREAARKALRAGMRTSPETILYRQEALRDCLANGDVARALYALSVEATDPRRRGYFGILARTPSSVLYEAIEQMRMLLEMLARLRSLAAQYGGRFSSRAFTRLFALVEAELSDEYLDSVRDHLSELRFRRGVQLSAALGEGGEGIGYVLHRSPPTRPRWREWLDRLLRRRPRGLVVEIAPRDEGGMRAMAELRDRGINGAANALAQSGDHVIAFFEQLRTELAFYLAATNLHRALRTLGAPMAFPAPAPAGERRNRFAGLYDPCLALRSGHPVVGTALAVEGRSLGVVTGANQGGKSTFLRSLGLAQLMMQAGLFVAAESFSADLCDGLFTHFRREEDASMKSGKLDEELARMSTIVDVLTPDALLLLNESFSATNEREGSEIARQVVTSLVERRVKVVIVTHLHGFARALHDEGRADTFFLRAERLADGTRTFRMIEGEPLSTSFGEDVYAEVFPPERAEAKAG